MLGIKMRKTLFLSTLFTGLLATAASPSWLPVSLTSDARATDDSEWEHLSTDEGITVWTLEKPGEEFPGFRGQTIINASLKKVVDVMMDSSKHTEWMYQCKESSVIKELTPTHAIIYTRVKAPWPVWDRDVVLDTVIKYNADETAVTMKFVNVAAAKSEKYRKTPNKVIRMPSLEGFYKLREISPGKTKILYQAESDIGGSIPTWLVNIASKDLPHITLAKLRERVTGVDGP
jgi:hypothetical protein